MEWAVWILVVAVIWIGADVAMSCRTAAKELTSIRQMLQVDSELTIVSAAAHLVQMMERLGMLLKERLPGG